MPRATTPLRSTTLGRRRPALLVGVLIVAGAAGCTAKPAPGPLVFAGQTVDHWLDELDSDAVPARRRAADALGNAAGADPRVVPALERTLRDPSALVRSAALLGLAKSGTVGLPAAAAVDTLLQDPHPQVRADAALTARRIRGERVEVQPR